MNISIASEGHDYDALVALTDISMFVYGALSNTGRHDSQTLEYLQAGHTATHGGSAHDSHRHVILEKHIQQCRDPSLQMAGPSG